MWPVRAQAPPVEAMGRFYPHSARRRPRLGRSVDGPLAWMNLIQWNNEYIYNVSITTGVGEGGLLRLLSPGSLGFQVAWDFRLVQARSRGARGSCARRSAYWFGRERLGSAVCCARPPPRAHARREPGTVFPVPNGRQYPIQA